jgi:uncharacterized protein YkwD
MFRRRAVPTGPTVSSVRRVLSAGAVVVLGASIGLGAAAVPADPADAATNCGVNYTDAEMDSAEESLFRMINDYRVSQGRNPLTSAFNLAWPATWMSRDSAGRGFAPSDHVDTYGRWIDRRLYECDYRGNRFAENVYYGWGSGGDPAAAFRWWQNSPDHNAVMLDPNMSHAGLARVCTDQCFYTLNTGDKGPRMIRRAK